MANRYAIPEETVEDLVLLPHRHNSKKHDLEPKGRLRFYGCEKDLVYAREIVDAMSNSELLEVLSQAIEARLSKLGVKDG